MTPWWTPSKTITTSSWSNCQRPRGGHLQMPRIQTLVFVGSKTMAFRGLWVVIDSICLVSPPPIFLPWYLTLSMTTSHLIKLLRAWAFTNTLDLWMEACLPSLAHSVHVHVFVLFFLTGLTCILRPNQCKSNQKKKKVQKAKRVQMVSWSKTMSCLKMLANQKTKSDRLVAQWNEIALKVHKAKTLIRLEVHQSGVKSATMWQRHCCLITNF